MNYEGGIIHLCKLCMIEYAREKAIKSQISSFNPLTLGPLQFCQFHCFLFLKQNVIFWSPNEVLMLSYLCKWLAFDLWWYCRVTDLFQQNVASYRGGGGGGRNCPPNGSRISGIVIIYSSMKYILCLQTSKFSRKIYIMVRVGQCT